MPTISRVKFVIYSQFLLNFSPQNHLTFNFFEREKKDYLNSVVSVLLAFFFLFFYLFFFLSSGYFRFYYFSRSIHLPKNTTEYHRIPQNTQEYSHITQEYPQRTCKYPRKTEKQIEFFYFPETTKSYQNLIKMITMKINGTISRHNI